MTEQRKAVAEHGRARASHAEAERELSELLVGVEEARGALEQALAEGDDRAAGTARAELEAQEGRRNEAAAELEGAAAAMAKAKGRALGNGAGFDLLSARHPLLLLPVRLETRFAWIDRAGKPSFAQSRGTTPSLLVRVYPDEVHDDPHEPELTGDELVLLKELDRRLTAGSDLRDLEAAWSDVIRRVGATRAGWLGEVLAGGQPPGRRPAVLSRPSVARLLPDRWVAIAELADGSVKVEPSTFPVREPLETGPSPDGIDWMVDWDAAVKAGMGIEMPNFPAVDVRRLVVLGARATLDPEETASALEGLFDAHHYTRGLSFMAPGTPTNSLPGARAGYTSRPSVDEVVPIERRRFGVFKAPGIPLCQPGDESDGTELAAALGIDIATFGYVERADASDRRDGRDLRVLLAAATGRPLSRLLEGIVDRSRLGDVLSFAVDLVSATGHFPTLRVGNQPYGVLPVLLRDDSRIPPDSLPGRLLPVLDRLRAIWDQATGGVRSIGDPGANPGETVIRILQQDAVARRIAFRPMVGPKLGARVATELRDPRALTAQREAAAQAIEGLGATDALAQPLLEALNVDFVLPLTAPLVRPDDAAPSSRQHPATYLEIVASLRPDFLLNHDYGGEQRPRSLLYSIARLAMLESADAAARTTYLADADPEYWDDEEVPSWSRDPLGTALRRLEYQLPPIPAGPGGTVAFQLSEQAGDTALIGLRDPLRRLKQRPPELLDELLRASLGLFSQRLDPWYTAFAVDRLRELRNDPASMSGLNVGAYGVVEDLRPSPLQPPGADGVYTSAINGGYVHAPSVGQGATAAVLRSVHLAHEAAGHGEAFSVDLSSERVRRGLELLEGIREGQPLSALLGYRIERQLAAENLQELIAPLRGVAPLVANKLTPGTEPAEAVAATNVIDGLTLLEDAGYDGSSAPSRNALWKKHSALATQFPAADGDALDLSLNRVLDAARDPLDAAADLSVAESVYQAVEGNPVRAGATVDGLSGAPVPPPEPGVVRTPGTGVGVTHRLLVLLGDPSGKEAWALTPRALAEPRLDGWARATLPPPERIGIRARFLDEEGGEVAALEDLTIESLNAAATPDQEHLQLGALDLVLAADPHEEPHRSALELRLMALIELMRPADISEATLQLVYERHEDWDETTFGLVEALEIGRQLRDAISRGRALAPEDLAPLSGGPSVAVAVTELEGRARDALGGLVGVRTALEPLVGSRDVAAIRKALFRADALGVAGAAPSTVRDAPGDDEEAIKQRSVELKDLQGQVEATLAELRGRESAVGKVPVADSAPRLLAIFGEAFTVLPVLEPAASLTDPFAPTVTPDGATPAAARTWLSRAAPVRSGAGALDAVLGYADAVSQVVKGAKAPALHVGQLGGAQGERWIAIPPDAGAEIPGGRVSLVAVAPEGDLPDPAVAGLMVDDWVEVVPSDERTTSVAFHYDAPTSSPPQVMLLGVPPPGHEAWSQDDALRIVDEALALARIRLVDADQVPDLGQLLPALVTEENPAGDAIGLDLDALTGGGP